MALNPTGLVPFVFYLKLAVLKPNGLVLTVSFILLELAVLNPHGLVPLVLAGSGYAEP